MILRHRSCFYKIKSSVSPHVFVEVHYSNDGHITMCKNHYIFATWLYSKRTSSNTSVFIYREVSNKNVLSTVCLVQLLGICLFFLNIASFV
jgi:E3 ubiquitin-protein ligase DOA10